MQSRARGGDDLRTNTKKIGGAEDEAGEGGDEGSIEGDASDAEAEEGAYHINNSVMQQVVKEALELQGYSMDQEPRGNKVKLSEVQAFAFEALGVKAEKKELRPIVEEMLEALAFARDEDAAEKRGQKLTREYK